MSTQPYLFTAPRKNSARFVPFSQMISARRTKRSSLTTNSPPSPEMMFFVSWKENAARCPIEPRGFLTTDC